jgi:hypothetical protein
MLILDFHLFLSFKALLGAQLVITLIFVSVIQKVSPHFSLAKWILCSTGFVRFFQRLLHKCLTFGGLSVS